MTGDGDGDEDRLRRIEEAAGFTEHAVDQLSQELTVLGPRLERLAARLEAIERRLAALEPPEHAEGAAQVPDDDNDAADAEGAAEGPP